MKKLLHFFGSFIPFLLSGFVYKYDPLFYENLKKPFFILPNHLFSFVWIAIFIIISISVVWVLEKASLLKEKDYFYTLLSNYFAVYAYIILFFDFKSPLFGFVLCIATFISSLLLYKETKKIINKSSLILIPYILFSIYAVLLSGFIFFMNF